MKKTVGVVIGRFQVDELTDGQVALLKHAKHCSDDLCVLVGVAPEASRSNPLPFDLVAQSIREDFPDLFHVHPLKDVPGCDLDLWGRNRKDLQWSWNVDRFLDFLFPEAEIKLYGGRDSFKDHYYGKHQPVVEFAQFDASINATRIREEIYHSRPQSTAAYRRGYIQGVGSVLQLGTTDRQLQSVPLEATTPQDDFHP